MATQEKDQTCDTLVQKLTKGGSLDSAEKSHLATCEDCMAQVVRMLDESVRSEAHVLGTTAIGKNGDLIDARPEAKKALDQGRRVFEREFGILLTKD
jgi:hypothetical protein